MPDRPDEYAEFADPYSGSPATIARYGNRVVVTIAAQAEPFYDEVCPTAGIASADYANWEFDPAAMQPREGDVIHVLAGGTRIRVVTCEPADRGGYYEITGVRLMPPDLSEVGPIAEAVYGGGFEFLSRRV